MIKRIYHHDAINLSNENVGCTLDLAKIAAIDKPIGIRARVHFIGGGKSDIIIIGDDSHAKLVKAWESYIEQEARKI